MLKKLWALSFLLVAGSVHAGLNIQHWTLDNGARVYFVENHAIPVFDVSVDFDAGARRDPATKSGIAALTNGMLARGIRSANLPDGTMESGMTESEISDALADVAAQRGGGPGTDRSGMSIRTLSSSSERDQSIHVLARLLAHPVFRTNFFFAIKRELFHRSKKV